MFLVNKVRLFKSVILLLLFLSNLPQAAAQMPEKDLNKSKESFGKIDPPKLEEGQKIKRFIGNANSTVTDRETGMMWASSDNGEDISWQDAERYCKKFNGGGYDDWRLPTQDELARLYTPNKRNEQGFSITPLVELSECCPWAADSSLNGAAIFSFRTGNRPWGFKPDTYQLRALPVRKIISKKTQVDPAH